MKWDLFLAIVVLFGCASNLQVGRLEWLVRRGSKNDGLRRGRRKLPSASPSFLLSPVSSSFLLHALVDIGGHIDALPPMPNMPMHVQLK